MAKLTEVTIKSRGFTYDQEIEDAAGNKTVVRQYARRGDTIKVTNADLKRGEEFNAFKTDEQEAAEEALGGQSVVDLSDDELDDLVPDLTVKEAVAAAEDDPENAQRILDAENRATGNDPRETLVRDLNKIISPEE